MSTKQMYPAENTTDVTVFRPDLPPLDAAMVLIDASIDHINVAQKAVLELKSTLTPIQLRIDAIIESVLRTAIEKQEAATEKIREYQRISGNN